MPTSRGALFLNPSSGAKLSAADIDALRAAATDAGLETIAISPDVDILSEIRNRMQQGMKLFVAAGGDGTINSVLQPLVNTDAELGVLPVGTFNHFARDLNIPLDWRSALNAVIQGTTMFLAQAARQFEIWTGHRAPAEIFEEKPVLS